MGLRFAMTAVVTSAALVGLAAAPDGTAAAPTPSAGRTSRVSVSTAGRQGNGDSGDLLGPVSMSADGRYVAFGSAASSLVTGDTNREEDVFVRDRARGTTRRVSVSTAGAQGNGRSGPYGISMSADGRFVAFGSGASNLVAGDTNGQDDVFVRDLARGVTRRVSLPAGSSAGAQADGDSAEPSVSGDGRFVAFFSTADNLVPGVTSSVGHVFVRDLVRGTTVLAGRSSSGALENAEGYDPAISADGRYVAYASFATNLVPQDSNKVLDVFVRDLVRRTTRRVSVSTGGRQGDGASGGYSLSVSDDGRYVAFQSEATDLAPGGSADGLTHLYVRDLVAGTTRRVDVSTGGAAGNLGGDQVALSGNGRYVAFGSSSSNLVPGVPAAGYAVHIYVRDLLRRTTRLADVSDGGVAGNDLADSESVAITLDGGAVAFGSTASNLVPGDTNGVSDVFVRQAPYAESAVSRR